RSLFVKISPFTLTRICSMISAPSEPASASDRAATATVLLLMTFPEPRILSLVEDLAQQSADPFEDAARRPRILLGRAGHLGLGEAGLHLARFRARRPPAWNDRRPLRGSALAEG